MKLKDGWYSVRIRMNNGDFMDKPHFGEVDGDRWYHGGGTSWMNTPTTESCEVLQFWGESLNEEEVDDAWVNHLSSYLMPVEKDYDIISYGELGSFSPLGWLSPQLQFFECGYHNHEESASAIGAKFYGDPKSRDELMEIGWIEVNTNSVNFQPESLSPECLGWTDWFKEKYPESKYCFSNSYEAPDSADGFARFFKPDSEMINWIAEYADGRFVYDFGCGNGELVTELNEIGVRATGFDSWYEKIRGVENTHAIDVTESNIIPKLKGALILFCRPNRGVWVEEAIKRLRYNGNEILYIGKPVNVFRDLDKDSDWYSVFAISHEGSSVDKEVVYKVEMFEEKLP